MWFELWDCHWRALACGENEGDASCINLCPFPQNVRSASFASFCVTFPPERCVRCISIQCFLCFKSNSRCCLSVTAEFSLAFFLLLNCEEGIFTTDVILSYYDGRNISICLLQLTWDSLKHVWIIRPWCMLLKRLLSVMSSYECCVARSSVLNLPNNVACSLEQCSICKCKLAYVNPPHGTK